MSLPSASTEAQNITLRAAQPADAVYLCSWRDEPSVRQFQPLGTASLAQLRAELGRQTLTDLFRGQGEKFQWIVRFEDRRHSNL